jgi:hypothetical protein
MNMHIVYSVFLNNFMCIHLENISKKEKVTSKIAGLNFL